MAEVRDFTGVAGAGRGVRAIHARKFIKNNLLLLPQLVAIFLPLIALGYFLFFRILEFLKLDLINFIFWIASPLIILATMLVCIKLLTGVFDFSVFTRVESGRFETRYVPKERQHIVTVLVDTQDYMSEPIYLVDYGYVDNTIKGVDLYQE